MKLFLILILLIVLPTGVWGQSTSGLVDPLQPSHYQPQPQPDQRLEVESLEQLRDQFQLTTILRASDRAVAIINGQSLQTGQKIADFRLLEVGRDYVVLEKKQQKLTIYRSVGDVQKTPATDRVTP